MVGKGPNSGQAIPTLSDLLERIVLGISGREFWVRWRRGGEDTILSRWGILRVASGALHTVPSSLSSFLSRLN